MNPTYDFTGQVALVTGASSGMGLATARAFAEAGAAVVLTDVNQDALREATDALTAAGHQALAVVCDVSDEAAVAAAVRTTVDTYGRLDMAFNNAGIQAPPTDAADEPADLFDRVNGVNLRGVWACMKHELAQMRTQGSGAIVNCSSLGGLVGLPGRAAYHASKHGVIGLTRSAALEYAPRGVRINAICPGTIATPMVTDMIDKGELDPADAIANQPINRLGDAERDRRGRPVAVQPRRQLRRRRGPTGRRRLHRPLTQPTPAGAGLESASRPLQPATNPDLHGQRPHATTGEDHADPTEAAYGEEPARAVHRRRLVRRHRQPPSTRTSGWWSASSDSRRVPAPPGTAMPRGRPFTSPTASPCMQSRGGDITVVHPGQTVYTPPGEEHWHGATPDDFMEHVAMFENRRRPRHHHRPGDSTSPTRNTTPARTDPHLEPTRKEH